MDCLPQLHVAAIHASPGYRGDIPGLGILCRSARGLTLGVGRYSNSVGKPTNYLAVGAQPLQWGPVRAGAFVGVLDGYPYKNGKAFLAGGLAFSVPTPVKGIDAHIVATPQTSFSPAVAALSFTFRLGGRAQQ
jgi:hypothetical protein